MHMNVLANERVEKQGCCASITYDFTDMDQLDARMENCINCWIAEWQLDSAKIAMDKLQGKSRLISVIDRDQMTSTLTERPK